MKAQLLRFALLTLSLLPGACHFTVTGPLLWQHSSSAAFDTWVGLWVFAVALPLIVWANTAALTPRK